MKHRGEAWKQRIGDDEYDVNIWDKLADPRLWLTVSGEAPTATAGNSFNKQSPSQKYQMVKELAKPQDIVYNKEGSVSFLVTTREASELLDIEKIRNFNVKIEKHQYKNRIRGTIQAQTIKLSEINEIEEELVEYGCIHVKKEEAPKRDAARNMVRDDSGNLLFESNGKATITFEKETLPTYVILFGQRVYVEPYEPDALQCKSCFEYGHLKKKCPNRAICGWCSKAPHTAKGERCPDSPHCRNCSEGHNNHSNFFKDCPTRLRENEIAKIKEARKVSYFEAKKILKGRTNTSHQAERAAYERPQEDLQRLKETVEQEKVTFSNLAQQLAQDLKEQMSAVQQQMVNTFSCLMTQQIELFRQEMARISHSNMIQQQQIATVSPQVQHFRIPMSYSPENMSHLPAAQFQSTESYSPCVRGYMSDPLAPADTWLSRQATIYGNNTSETVEMLQEANTGISTETAKSNSEDMDMTIVNKRQSGDLAHPDNKKPKKQDEKQEQHQKIGNSLDDHG